jgi:hypothetical protein|nr:MAG TPA: hypothetical protein [Caudoviricetes sp.]
MSKEMIILKDTEYLERCWQAETWKELAGVITNYTWIATDGNMVSMQRKITRTKQYLKNRILTESKIRRLTGEEFKKRKEQIKLTFVMEIDEQLGKATQLWHYNKKADEAGISEKERMEYFVNKAIKKANKYFKLFQ